jgi:hypothetical protein
VISTDIIVSLHWVDLVSSSQVEIGEEPVWTGALADFLKANNICDGTIDGIGSRTMPCPDPSDHEETLVMFDHLEHKGEYMGGSRLDVGMGVYVLRVVSK